MWELKNRSLPLSILQVYFAWRGADDMVLRYADKASSNGMLLLTLWFNIEAGTIRSRF